MNNANRVHSIFLSRHPQSPSPKNAVMPIYYFMLHAADAAFGVRDCPWAEIQAIVHKQAASFKKVSSVAEGRALLRVAASQRGRGDVVSQLDREDEEAERAARLARAVRLAAEFKASRAREAQRVEAAKLAVVRADNERAETRARTEHEATKAVANAARPAREQREVLLQAARERELADLRRRHADAAKRTIAAAAAQLSRASSLPRSLRVMHDDVPSTFSGPAPFASIFISSAFARQGGGLVSCTILFTTTRILWVNTCIFSHGSHAKAQLRALFVGLKEASSRELPSVDVHFEHETLGDMLTGLIKPAPKLRRLVNHLSAFSSISYKIVSQQPGLPVVEVAHKLFANAHVSAKTVGLKRLRSL